MRILIIASGACAAAGIALCAVAFTAPVKAGPGSPVERGEGWRVFALVGGAGLGGLSLAASVVAAGIALLT